jgi:hypothetical protein
MPGTGLLLLSVQKTSCRSDNSQDAYGDAEMLLVTFSCKLMLSIRNVVRESAISPLVQRQMKSDVSMRMPAVNLSFAPREMIKARLRERFRVERLQVLQKRHVSRMYMCDLHLINQQV